MKDYFRKHGIRVLLIVVAAVLIIGLSAAARGKSERRKNDETLEKSVGRRYI